MIYNLGSINSDVFYSVPALPGPGETLAASGVSRDLGGKGANMSFAAAKAGGHVRHIGAVGEDGCWAVEQLREAGIETQIAILQGQATGQAVILRDPKGENTIVTLAGANRALDRSRVLASLDGIGPGDVMLFQNETNAVTEAAEAARKAGAHIVCAAAPFCAASVQEILPFVDTLVLNSVEMTQLQAAMGLAPEELGLGQVVVTQGAQGATLFQKEHWAVTISAPRVQAVDTTGAGDTLTGYLAAGIDAGRPFQDALETAVFAASLMVTKKGTASAIPSQSDVDAFVATIR
ncbi:MAG: ribokinase [Pseudomonadota bacterium]